MKKKVCIVVSSEMTIKAFLKEHILALSEYYEVTLIFDKRSSSLIQYDSFVPRIIPVAIKRRINPIADLRALFQLIRIFRENRFDLVHSVTPKAGLLAMLAGKISGISFRVHTFTGQVWASKTGLLRALLKSMDSILALSATHLLVDSISQRQFLIQEGVIKAYKSQVLASGSICGVDLGRFRANKEVRNRIRKDLGVMEQSFIILYMGRLNQEKGVIDLASAFNQLAGQHDKLYLFMVGKDEACLRKVIENRVSDKYKERLRFIDFTDKPEDYLAAVDVLCLPSYREGFGNVVIEAAACGVPAIGSDVYGLSDAVKHNETGLLYSVGDVDALARAISQMVDDEYREKLGNAAFSRVEKYFSKERVVEAWLSFYGSLL